MSEEKAIKAKFTLPWLPGEFDGYHFTGPADKWNGHPIPFFDLEEMWRIISAIYDSARPEMIDTEDGEKALHPLGGQAWPWDKVKGT